MGLIVSRTRDGDIAVRQPPGPRNALGRLKINFPNAFHVYLHDTPDKHLFKRDQRAYSAGCMRVQDPDQFSAQVLAIGLPEAGYTAERLNSMSGPSERWIALEKRIPIHIVYMNAYVADNGKLIVRPDVYGYDARVQSALKGRYLVVKERSQRGSTVVRAADTSRSVTRRPSRPQPDQLSARAVWHEPRSAFGFWGWSRGY
jgi:murein L,D-transpeptidase YcbB/YkuD